MTKVIHKVDGILHIQRIPLQKNVNVAIETRQFVLKANFERLGKLPIAVSVEWYMKTDGYI